LCSRLVWQPSGWCCMTGGHTDHSGAIPMTDRDTSQRRDWNTLLVHIQSLYTTKIDYLIRNMVLKFSEIKDLIRDQSFNAEKFEQVVHYIVRKTSDRPNVGKKVLYKLLYFSDFDFYELFEKLFTGEKYSRIEHGPAPRHFNKIIEKLEREGKVQVVKTTYHGKPQIRYVSLIEPSLSKLNGDELKHLDKTLAKYAGLNGSQIEAISHEDLPCRATDEKRDIDYELVFYRDKITSVREYPDDRC
jgi:uncharacterized phage-associated protein